MKFLTIITPGDMSNRTTSKSQCVFCIYLVTKPSFRNSAHSVFCTCLVLRGGGVRKYVLFLCLVIMSDIKKCLVKMSGSRKGGCESVVAPKFIRKILA